MIFIVMNRFWLSTVRSIRRVLRLRSKDGRTLWDGTIPGTAAAHDRPLAFPESVATVYRCVKLLGDMVGMLPVLVQRRTGEGIWVPTEIDGLERLFNVEPEPGTTACEMWAGLVRTMLVDGSSFLLPMTGRGGRIERVVLASPKSVSYDEISDVYRIEDWVHGIHETRREADVIHLRGIPAGGGKLGKGVVTWYAGQTIRTACQGNRETEERFRNGGNVRGIITNESGMTGYGEYQDAELSGLAASLNSKFRADGERIVSIPGRATFRELTLSSTDMQFLESRKFTVREICRFFGVHPSFVFDDTSNNYKSAEMANVAFLSQTLNPLLVQIEQELRRKLLPGSRDERLVFDRSGLMACDLETQVRWRAARIAAGLDTPNEARRADNKPGVEGGDTPLVSANLRTLTEILQPRQPKTETP